MMNKLIDSFGIPLQLKAGLIEKVRVSFSVLSFWSSPLEITVDDIVVSPVGPTGAVRRNIALDPDKLLAGSNSTELDL